MKKINLKLFLLRIILITSIFNLPQRAIGQSSFNNLQNPSSTNFSNSEFRNSARFFEVHFDSIVNFTNSKFHSTVYFDDAQFHFYANFLGSTFDSTASFSGAKFDSIVNLGYSKFHSTLFFFNGEFNSEAYFEFSKFDSTVHLSNSEFNSKSFFSSSEFKTIASFDFVKFNSETNFSFVEFDSIADFRNALFGSKVNFQYATFNSKANFNNSEFYSEANFGYITLPDTLFFDKNIKIKQEIDFTTAVLKTPQKSKDRNHRCLISLIGSDISKIKINYELFQLYFPTGTSYELIISTYEKLLKKFKDDGFLNSYKLLDIEYQNYKNLYRGDVVQNTFMKVWWNYGYNREMVLLNTFLILLLIILVNFFIFPFLFNNVYSINYSFLEIQSGKFLSIIFRRLFNSIFYSCILFFGVRIVLDNFKKVNGIRTLEFIGTVWVFLIFLSGLFCLSYVLNILIVR